MRSIVAFLAVSCLVLGAGASSRAAEPIKIGAVLSTTGPGAYLGTSSEKTLRLEIDRVNRAGGLLGRPLKLVFYDDGCDPRQAVTFARRLIDVDRVDVIIGASLVGSTLAIAPIAEDAEMPLIGQPGSTAVVEPLRKWVFLATYTDRMGVQKDFEDFQKRNFTKIGLIAGSRGYDESCRRQAHSLAPKFGITFVAEETYAPEDTDQTPQLIRIREHKDLQAVLSCGSQAPTVITVRNYRQLGMSKIPLYFTTAVSSPSFLSSIGAAGEGIRMIATPLTIADQLPDKDPQKKLLLEYTKAYAAAFHEPADMYGGQALDSLILYAAAVKSAGTTDKSKVRAVLEQSKNVIGSNGIFNMSPTDHNGLTAVGLHVLEVHAGNWKLLY